MKGPQTLIFLVVLSSLIAGGVAFYTFYIARDYMVFANVPCDPALHSCFIGDGDNTPQYYEEVSKKANTIPVCNGWLNQCPELNCAQDDSSCMVTYCEPDTEVACYGPVSASQ